MIDILKETVLRLLESDPAWIVVRPFARFKPRLVARRSEYVLRRKTMMIVKERFGDLVVKSGPFRGLQYIVAESICSALVPKLLGSYESELHETLERLLCNDYDLVLDIGCAEGFYAVGIAKTPGWGG